MRVLVFLTLTALVGFSQAASLKKTADCEDGTLCPGGCCPEANWYCCPDGLYCAATAGDCPFLDYRQNLIKAAAKKITSKKALAKTADCEDGTLCPGGCCPEANWYCCPDGLYCAATAGDCPFVAAKEKLIKMAVAKKVAKTADCEDGTLCPGGCCPEANWYCCPDGLYCAATAGDCPFVNIKEKMIKMAVAKKVAEAKDCEDGTLCPGGCCPEANWYCCPDGLYCAATAGDCPFVAAKEKLMKMAAAKRVALAKTADCEDGTLCPGGCCPEANWYCCPDGLYCAATAGDCPFVAAKEKLMKMAAAKRFAATKDCEDGTLCPGGCCPEANWYCCPDGLYCAATAGDCPFVAAKEKLMKMAAPKKVALAKTADCEDGTLCPGGCCPEANWYCCPDGLYCAATAGDCPFVNIKEKMIKMAVAKKVAEAKDCEDGTLCPGGCCPEANWYCCPDGLYCAATAGDCPFVAAKEKLMKMAAPKKAVLARTADCEDGTLCPAGCCPEANWYCCPDGLYCAATAGDCPFRAAREQYKKMFHH